jgi:photosystem II oxygen-evolving enhancer protein 3
MAALCATSALSAKLSNGFLGADKVAVSSAKSSAVKVGAVSVRASAEEQHAVSRRESIGAVLLAALAAPLVASEAKAEALKIPLAGPPPPIGGLPGTESADQARDTDAPLKERFYLQPLDPVEALKRARESADRIISVKPLIEKKAWPYVQNDLRSKAGYLRFDLNTVINAKPRAVKKELTGLANKLFDRISALDYACRKKDLDVATKEYAATVELLETVLSKAA